jgi:flagellar biosynthesis GTPase FlhF
VDIQDATQNLQKEIETISTNKEIEKTEKSIQKLHSDVSQRNKQFEEEKEKLKEIYLKDLKKLNEIYERDINEFEETKLKFEETLGALKNMKDKLKSANILDLLKMRNEHDAVSDEIIGEIYSFKNNSNPEMGNSKKSTLQLISSFKSEKLKNVVCGGYHTIILTGKHFNP